MPEQSEQSGHEGGLNTPLVNHLHNTQELVSAHELLVNAQELLVSAQERLMRAHELLVRAQELSLTIQELLSKTQKLLKNTQCLLVIHKNCRSMHSTHLFAMYQQESMHSQCTARTCLRCISNSQCTVNQCHALVCDVSARVNAQSISATHLFAMHYFVAVWIKHSDRAST